MANYNKTRCRKTFKGVIARIFTKPLSKDKRCSASRSLRCASSRLSSSKSIGRSWTGKRQLAVMVFSRLQVMSLRKVTIHECAPGMISTKSAPLNRIM